MKYLLLIFILVFRVYIVLSQVISVNDPDSVMAEWIEQGEWEGVSLHPDIALDWLLDMDSSAFVTKDSLPARKHMVTVNVPLGAKIFDWTSDSGKLVSPVSIKYRIRVSEPHRWEFRLQTNQNAGDACRVLPDSGVPEHVTGGLLIRPGTVFQEIIIGDYQVNSGFGAVIGSSPVFSVSLGNPGSLFRPGKGIRLHTGTDEGRFFRGLAANMRVGKSELILYGSGKDRVQEEVAGMGWKRVFTNSELGITGIRVNVQDPPIIKEGWAAVWQPDSGRYSRIGVWGQTRVPFGIALGEAGWSPNGGYGWIAGFRWFEANGFSAVLRYSGSTPGYPVTYTMFQSGTALTKEGQRIIGSFRYSPVKQFEWLGSFEVNMAQWPGTNARFGNYSTRIAQQLKFLSKETWTAAVSFQLDFLESAAAVPQKLTWKLAFDSDPKQAGSLRFRAGFRQQIQGFGETLSKGSTADCSLIAFLCNRKLAITTGFRLFAVETGTDPLYAYEPDVLFGWSAPVLTGSGTRWFATARCKLLKNIDLEIKVSQTSYSDLKHRSENNAGGMSGKVQVSWMMR